MTLLDRKQEARRITWQEKPKHYRRQVYDV